MILNSSSQFNHSLRDRDTRIPIISSVSGRNLNESTLGSLLHRLITEILTSQIRVDFLIDGLCQCVPSGVVQLIPVHTQTASSLTTSLRQKGLDVECINTASPGNRLAEPDHSVPGHDPSKIAIIGFSGRFPEADGLDEFWSLLQQGSDVHKPIPDDRFDAKAHWDPTLQKKNTSRILHGCWIRNPGLFDARFFHFSPREVCQADPAQRLALLTVYEAIEMAGLVPDRTASTLRHRVGVYYGTTSDDWREVNSGQDVDTYFIPGGNRAFIPGRLNYFFKFSGPSVSVDTACSSSLAAINVACTALLNRECDTALAGGTNIMTNPDNFAGLDRGHFLSTTGNCKTFDDRADGYCRADGVGTVILKRLPDAIADEDPIFGVILGAHTSHSAEAVSITRPLPDAQEYIFRQLLTESGIHPHEVSYIEMHGTGTQAGDAVEMKSVLDTFAWDTSRPRDRPLHLGSVKSNVGHGESASGVTALIKVLLMMQKNCIPPHCGIKTKINHGFPTNLEARNVHIARSETEWIRPKDGKRRTFVNNFSAAGGNTALMLEDAAVADDGHQSIPRRDPRRHHLVTVSARSDKSLRKNLQALAHYIGSETSPDILSRLAYTTTARRMHHSRRVAVVGDDLQQTKRILLNSASLPDIRPCSAKVPPIGFFFTGQGAQETAMARDLHENIASFRGDIVNFDCISRAHGFPSFLPLVTGAEDVAALSPTIVQIGTVAVQIALARLWQNWGLVPSYVIGHSLGEFAALCMAGVLSISDTLHLTGERALLLQRQCTAGTHGMLAVKASASETTRVLGDIAVVVACFNGPQDTVLSGPNDDIDKASEKLSEKGLPSTKLVLPFAFHSSQVDSMMEGLVQVAGRLKFHAPTIPVISSLLGRAITEAGVFGPEYIRRHCREPVNFLGAVTVARSIGAIDSNGVAIEIGAHPILTRMTKNLVGSEFRIRPSLRRKEDTFKTLSEALSELHLAGVPVNWDEYHRDFKMSHKVLPIPGYNWDYENHWIQYQNNWCLNKGSSPEVSRPPVSTPVSTRLSSSVQKIVKEEIGSTRAQIVVESDFHDSELLPVALDHRVNGLILCPSSLYADIAYTLGRYVAEKDENGEHLLPDVGNMIVEKALVVKETDSQLFQALLDYDWSTRHGEMQVCSVDNSGKRTVRHAQCTIDLQQPEVWQNSWRRHLYLIQRSIDQLKQGVTTGQAHKVRRGLAYKLFSSVVQYGPSYHGMEEVTFDSSGLEATAKVCLQQSKGQYALNPFWCDSFGHLTGFIMNSNDFLDLSEHVFINHGWSLMRCSERFSTDYVYQTHVRMQPVGVNDSLYSGDVYVLRDNQIVAHYGSVTFQKVARRVLEMLLLAPKPKSPSVYPVATTTSRPTPESVPRRRRAEQTLQASTVWQQALRVIANEIGVQVDQLTDDVEFADMGVDSLMSLTILGSFRETLNLDVPASLFEDCSSVRSLRKFLEYMSSGTSSDDASVAALSENSTAATTPMTVDGKDQTNAPGIGSPEAVSSKIMAILAQEIGISTKELTKVDDLAEVGLDSLLSLTVLGRVREELGVDLPADLFLESTSLSAITLSLRATFGAIEQAPQSSVTSHPQSTSILLQGTPSCSQTLFLFPDGSGSSTSYAMLPTISPNVCVYGMNCPYMRDPQNLKCALQDLTPPYVTEIRRRQPLGPYNLAGWSAGGIAAYHAAQYLVQQGETVERLILLDSPNPIGLGKLPPRFYRVLEEAGVFGSHGGQKPPPWLIQHFLAFIDALDQYKPIPFQPAGAAPKTTLIWALDGVEKSTSGLRFELQPDDPKEIAWLWEDRTDLGPNGWETLLGRRNIHIETLARANHFSMVREPAASRLVEIMRGAMST
ncbi:polyketide synthase [Aspergillus terreus]|uniref:Polyketide synthase n=1 Tax=Aspergillus terreus TaxID=33178 RepID=A0A5M3ZDR9_ASPTE|nr:hypothetical protein ATETN484_0017007200 [Aspergillus terreus]GFF21743.1 polyketide synthase [Aspergillus terreus]